MAAVARCSWAPRGLLLPRAGECHRRRGAAAGGPPLSSPPRGETAALALSTRAYTVLSQLPARGPPFFHRGVLGGETSEGAGRPAPGNQMVKLTVCGRNGPFSACLLCRERRFVAQRVADCCHSRTVACLTGTVKISPREVLSCRLNVWIPFTISWATLTYWPWSVSMLKHRNCI